MTTLRGAWRIRTYSNTVYTDLYLRADETAIDKANNTSTITSSLSIYNSGGAYSCDNWSCGLIGTANKENQGSLSVGSGKEVTLATSSFEVVHNEDGTGTATVGCWFKTTWGNSIDYHGVNITLTKIARGFTSTPSLTVKSKDETSIVFNWSTSQTASAMSWSGGGTASGFSPGTSGTITVTGLTANTEYTFKPTFTRKDTSVTTMASCTVSTYNYPHAHHLLNVYTGSPLYATLYNPLGHSVTVTAIVNGTALADTVTTTGTTIGGWQTGTGLTQVYSALANVSSAEYYFKVVYGSVTKTSDKATVTVSDDNKPTVAYTACYEQNSTITSVVGSNKNYYYKNISKLSVWVTASGKNSATIKSVSATIDGEMHTATSASNRYYKIGNFTNLTTAKTISITATDSRGLINTISVDSGVTFNNYERPTLTLTVARKSQSSNVGTATVKGAYYNNGNNSVTLYFDGASTATTDVTSSATISSGNITYTKTYDGETESLNYVNSYLFTAKAVDKFGGETSVQFTLGKGVPVLWLGEDTVYINSQPLGIGSGLNNSFFTRSSGTTTSTWWYLCDIDCKAHEQGEFIGLRVYFAEGNNGKVTQNAYYDLTGQIGYINDEKKGAAGWNAELNPLMNTNISISNSYFKIIYKNSYQYSVYFYCSKNYCIPNVVFTCGNENIVNLVGTTSTTAPTGDECNISHINVALRAYPIGSIYTSMNSTNPGNIFGGTWVRLTSTFLWATVGSESGTTGGTLNHTHTTAGHTLTINEIPSHQHNLWTYPSIYNSGSGNDTTSPAIYNTNKGYTNGKTAYAGGSGSHSHGATGSTELYPPFTRVFMWYRAA